MFPTTVQASVLCVTFAVSALSLWWVIAHKRRKHCVHVGKVRKLFFYPVKALKGIEVSSVDCVEKGIQVDGTDDRCFMIVTEDGANISQYEEPCLTLLTPSISGNRLCVSGPAMEDLMLDLRPCRSPLDKIVSCVVVEERAQAIDCGDEAAAWFQKFLNKPGLRLVYSDESLEKRKVITKNRVLKKIRQQINVSFQNVAPLLLLSQESIDDLNSKLEETRKISVKNFRPNILVEGCNAFDEDKWSFIKFPSGAELTYLVPCGRCITVTNNPETGIRTNNEPLKTLRKYRKPTDENFKASFGPSPLFGVRFGVVNKGEIAVGDDVYAVVEQKPFKY